MNILVTGSNGQLGSELKRASKESFNDSFFFTDVDDLDICNDQAILDYMLSNKIELVINCAAYTAVDKAETEVDTARLLNATAVGYIVKACQKTGSKLIHISTDYVFNGEHFKPLNESVEERPLGVYGNTKREGERFVIDALIEGIVIRTSWLYSSYGNNFVKTMMRLGSEREELKVIFDQIGTPTYAKDLANVIIKIIARKTRLDENGKVYHYSNEGATSWYDFAKAIMEFANLNCLVMPIATCEYPTPAKRPHYSVMDKTKIKNDFKTEIPYWRDSLKECIELIKS